MLVDVPAACAKVKLDVVWSSMNLGFECVDRRNGRAVGQRRPVLRQLGNAPRFPTQAIDFAAEDC